MINNLRRRESGLASLSGLMINRRRFLLGALLFAGAIARLLHLALIDLTLPVESGGLFLEFARQIAAAGYRLPAIIPYYTPGGVPYAYPPLAFYLEAALIHGLGLPEWPVASVLPALLAIAALPLFYALARAVYANKVTPLVALGVYALLPAAYVQQVQDEGLAEGAGTLALLLLVLTMLAAERRGGWGRYALVGLGGALCVLAAPGSAVAAALLLGLWGAALLVRAGREGRFARQLAHLALAAAVLLAASAPYWLAVARVHGAGLFITAFMGQGGGDEGLLRGFVDRALQFPVAQSPYGALWNALILAGVVWSVARGRWRLPVWLAAMLFVPREWDWLVGVPAALLAAEGVVAAAGWLQPRLANRRVGTVLALALLLYAALNVLVVARLYAATQDPRRSRDTLAAAEWARANLPATARFVVVDDSVREWFPHAVQREVVNVSQGSEWQPAENAVIRAFNRDLEACDSLDCLDEALTPPPDGEGRRFIMLNDPDGWPQYNADPPFVVRYRNDTAVVLEYPE